MKKAAIWKSRKVTELLLDANKKRIKETLQKNTGLKLTMEHKEKIYLT